jgi:hypothetical protein
MKRLRMGQENEVSRVLRILVDRPRGNRHVKGTHLGAELGPT